MGWRIRRPSTRSSDYQRQSSPSALRLSTLAGSTGSIGSRRIRLPNHCRWEAQTLLSGSKQVFWESRAGDRCRRPLAIVASEEHGLIVPITPGDPDSRSCRADRLEVADTGDGYPLAAIPVSTDTSVEVASPPTRCPMRRRSHPAVRRSCRPAETAPPASAHRPNGRRVALRSNPQNRIASLPPTHRLAADADTSRSVPRPRAWRAATWLHRAPSQ